MPLARFRFPLAVYLPSICAFWAMSHSVLLRKDLGLRRSGIERGSGDEAGLGAARACWVARDRRHESVREWGRRCMAEGAGEESEVVKGENRVVRGDIWYRVEEGMSGVNVGSCAQRSQGI